MRQCLIMRSTTGWYNEWLTTCRVVSKLRTSVVEQCSGKEVLPLSQARATCTYCCRYDVKRHTRQFAALRVSCRFSSTTRSCSIRKDLCLRFRFPAVDLTWRVEPIETIVTLSLVRYEIQPLANIGLIGSFASIVEGFGVTTAAAA